MTLGSTVSNAWSYFNESKKRKHEVMNGLAEDASDPKPNHSTQASAARIECDIPAKRPRIDNQTMPNNGAESTSWFVKFKNFGKTTLNIAWDKLMGHHGNSHSDDGASTSSAETNCDSNRIIGSSGSDSVGYQSPVEPIISQNDVTSTHQHFDPMNNYTTGFQAQGFEVKKKKKSKFSSYFDKMKYRDLLNRHVNKRPILNRKPTANPLTPPEVVDLTDDEQHIPLPIAESTSHSIGELPRVPRFKTDIMDRNSRTTMKMIKRIRETPPVVSALNQTTIKPLWSVDRKNKLIATQSWTSLLNNSAPNTKNSRLPTSSFNDRHSTPRSSSPNERQDSFTSVANSQRRASMAALPESCTKFKDKTKKCEYLELNFVSGLKNKSNEDLSIERKLANFQISVEETRNKRETDYANLSHKIREPINRTEIQPFGAYVPYIETDDKEEEEFDEEEEEEEDEGPSSYPLLTPEMVVMIEDAWVSTPPNQVLCEGPTGQICRKDMETLKGLNWLNDEIINFYLSLIVERGKNDNFSSVYAFNTFFYKKLRDSGPQSLKRWTRRVDVFANDFIFIPIHLGMHWCLAVINFIDKKIEYYDSMGGRNDECVNALKDWLQAESMDKKKVELPMTDWTLVMAKGIPQQNNGSDCGMFTCKYAEYISRKAKINFSQAHMPYFRRRMVYEILTKQLL